MIDAISQMEDNDDQAFLMDIFDRYYPLMLSRARKMLREGADDAVQNAFVRLIRNVSKLRSLPAPALVVYITKTVNSAALDLMDYDARRKHWGIDDENEAVSDSASSPEQIMLNREMASYVSKALSMLSDFDRNLLYYYLETDFTTEEIASMMSIAPKSIYTYISRARKRAVKLMEGLYYDR